MGAFSALELRLIGAVIALVGLFGLAMYLEHRGAEKCMTANVAAVQAQTAHNASVAAVQDVVIAQEKKDYVEALGRPLVRPISLSLCDATPAVVPAAPAPRSKPDAAAPGPAIDRKPVVPSATLGPGLQMTGKQADAQINALQSYIRDVCLKR